MYNTRASLVPFFNNSLVNHFCSICSNEYASWTSDGQFNQRRNWTLLRSWWPDCRSFTSSVQMNRFSIVTKWWTNSGRRIEPSSAGDGTDSSRPRTDSFGGTSIKNGGQNGGQSNGTESNNSSSSNWKRWMEEDFKIEEEDLETREVPVGGMNYGDYLQVIRKKKYE